MRRFAIVMTAALALGAMVTLAHAADGDASPPDAVSGQSVAPAAAAAHDHGETCGGGGACCSACQIRQKYAKEKAADDDGGCPCQRAKKAREQALADGE